MRRPDQESPCRYCTEETGRQLYCHTTCKRYQDYVDAVKQENRKIYIKKNSDSNYIHYMVCKTVKSKKRNKRGGE